MPSSFTASLTETQYPYFMFRVRYVFFIPYQTEMRLVATVATGGRVRFMLAVILLRSETVEISHIQFVFLEN